ncbi:hypothetical protein [Micromonospora sp. CA-246542]|uniref:hypothetical protein n=1 Tax=Micromonospora sp. CA-246542 TaxID=3239959 RepID=UPI003D8C8502
MNDDTAVLQRVPGDAQGGDGLASELAKAAPRRWWNRATVILAVAVLLVGGFAAGLQVQKSYGGVSAEAGGGNRPAGGQRAGQGGFGSGNSRPDGGAAPTSAAPRAASGTAGTVKLVNGTTIYVETADGDVVAVKTDGKTSVAVASKGKLSDIRAGQPVTVQGIAGADGTVTATSVTSQPK